MRQLILMPKKSLSTNIYRSLRWRNLHKIAGQASKKAKFLQAIRKENHCSAGYGVWFSTTALPMIRLNNDKMVRLSHTNRRILKRKETRI